MSKKTKAWLIIATSFVIFGCILFGGFMTVLNWDFMKLSTNQFVTNRYEISKEFDDISISTDTTNIAFVITNNDKIIVECYEDTKLNHSVIVDEGILKIENNDTRKWYDKIGVNFGIPKVTVFIPEREYCALVVKTSTSAVDIPDGLDFENINISLSTGSVSCCASAKENIKIETSTGDIHIEDLLAKNIELSVTTGKVIASNITCDTDMTLKTSTGKSVLKNVECKNFTSSGNTGDLSLNNVLASENISVVRTTGNIEFDCLDASDINVKTSTGKVDGSLLSEKIFYAHTSTGKIDVPESVNGGKCKIETSTGNIHITIKE